MIEYRSPEDIKGDGYFWSPAQVNTELQKIYQLRGNENGHRIQTL